MPELEYAILCDYARVDAGIAHIIAANINRVAVPQIPAGQNFGLVIAIIFERDEIGRDFPFKVSFHVASGSTLIEIDGQVTGPDPGDQPEEWPIRYVFVMPVGVILPQHGEYAFDIAIEGDVRKTLNLMVVPPGE